MAKSDLLKEAIADANAVRETALANAKLALEEAFTPRIQSMLSAKLSEELEDEEEEGIEGMMRGSEMREQEDEMDMGEPEMDEPEMDEPEKGGSGNVMNVSIDDPNTPQSPDFVGDIPSAEEMEGEDEMGEEDDLDLESIIRELEGDLEEPAMEEGEMRGKEMRGKEMRGNDDETMDEDIDAIIEAILGESNHDNKLEKIADSLYDTTNEYVDYYEWYDDEKGFTAENVVVVGEPYIHQFLKACRQAKLHVEAKDEFVDGNGVKCFVMGEKSLKEKMGAEDGGGMDLVEEKEAELEEAYSTIKQLQSVLQEVNLLNAKLLYTNKLFRNFELSENQKMKVIENFDRAGNTREVKLVFSTLAESFHRPATKKVVVKEHKNVASKAAGTTKPAKEIISEGNEMANRFKKLAGLL